VTKYLLSIIQPDGPTLPPAFLEKVMREMGQVMKELKDSGSWVFNGGLCPATSSTVVQVKESETIVTDGPYAEGKEHVGGFIVVQAADLDAALGWARKFARVITLPIEVRPFQHLAGCS